MENQDKIFCGSAKIVNTKYGELTKVSFHKDDINRIVSFMKDSNSDWANLVIKAKKEPQDGKPTHYLEIDTWKPEPKADQGQSYPTQTKNESSQDFSTSDIDDLPF